MPAAPRPLCGRRGLVAARSTDVAELFAERKAFGRQYYSWRHPLHLGPGEVTAFLSDLATRGRVSASTQNQALAALLFLYRHVLDVDLPWLDGLIRAKRPERLPVVLSRDEVRLLLERLDGTPKTVATLLYGAGLRLLEALHLRIQDVDFSARHLIIRSGKGDKDRRAL